MLFIIYDIGLQTAQGFYFVLYDVIKLCPCIHRMEIRNRRGNKEAIIDLKFKQVFSIQTKVCRRGLQLSVWIIRQAKAIFLWIVKPDEGYVLPIGVTGM